MMCAMDCLRAFGEKHHLTDCVPVLNKKSSNSTIITFVRVTTRGCLVVLVMSLCLSNVMVRKTS
jgi:hypothetical protein